jgi:hypothetical protein
MSNKMNTKSKPEKPLILSYLALRRTIGVLGVMLPVALSLGAYLISRTELQSSISSYYYTEMGNVFVGTLCAIGVFMLSYKGYECADAVASRLGGIFSICTALFPTKPDFNYTINDEWIGGIHLVFAGLFFISTAYMSIFLFTKTSSDRSKITGKDYLSLFSSPKKQPGRAKIHSKKKLQRNLVYIACGVIILVCILCIGIFKSFCENEGVSGGNGNLVFWLEATAVFAFGTSWLIKGETLFRDKTGSQ